MSLQRFHVGDRLSEMAVHNGTVYLAGQVPDDATQGHRGQTGPGAGPWSTSCSPKPAATARAS